MCFLHATTDGVLLRSYCCPNKVCCPRSAVPTDTHVDATSSSPHHTRQPRNTYYWDDTGYWGPHGEPNLNSTSLPLFVKRMTAAIRQRSAWLRTNNLLFPWG